MNGIISPADNKTLGLIAGNGNFPLAFIEEAKRQGFKVVVAAHIGETDPSISTMAASIVWVYLGQVDKIVKFFRSNGVKTAAFLGGIKRVGVVDAIPLLNRFWSEKKRPLALDWRALRIIKRIKSLHDDSLLRGVASEFEDAGIKIISASLVLQKWLIPSGLLVSYSPISVSDRNDLLIGWDAAEALGLLDIGQTVVVSRGVVIALEAVEGTDSAIKRAGLLSSGAGGVVVKLSKPQQDLRLDLPSIGVATLNMMSAAKLNTLLVRANTTLIFEPHQVVQAAQSFGINILAVESREDLQRLC